MQRALKSSLLHPWVDISGSLTAGRLRGRKSKFVDSELNLIWIGLSQQRTADFAESPSSRGQQIFGPYPHAPCG